MSSASTASTDDLLVSLDTAERGADSMVATTVDKLMASDEPDAAALSLLVAFKRRNHEKSLAENTGSGEKRFLLSVVKQLLTHDQGLELVQRIIPLIPMYGSWRDLLVLAEDLAGAPAEEQTEATKAIVQSIVTSFATQLKADDDAMELDEAFLPSNAAKYAPHGKRHGGATSALPAKRNRTGGGAAKRPRAALGNGSKSVSEAGAVAKLLGKAVATELGFPACTSSADYRKLRTRANRRLTERGHLVEPLLCMNDAASIKFKQAPKGALEKYKKAIMADEVAARRWAKAQNASLAAVADLNDLGAAVVDWRDEELEADESLKFFGKRVEKAIESAKDAKAEVLEAALDVLRQLESGADDVTTPQLTDSAILPMVGAGGKKSLETRLLAAFLVLKSQGLTAFAVHDEVISVGADIDFGTFVELVKESGATERVSCPDTLQAGATALLARYKADQAAAADAAKALKEAAAAEEEGKGEGDGEGTSLPVGSPDILFLCSDFSPYTVPAEGAEVDAVVQALQTDEGMRSLLVHRLRSAKTSSASDCAYRARCLRPLPAQSDVVVDLCIVMDCTGSMGSWIEAAQDHLTTIIDELVRETDVKDIRVGFVAYRDWQDHGRKVVEPFASSAKGEVGRVVQCIRNQSADGGGDEPEDVISGIEGALSLDWQGDVRMCLFVADACAHGYLPGQGVYKGHDDFEQGLCPDQKVLLPDLMNQLAHDDGVDLLFCQITDRTSKMEEMFKGIYAAGESDKDPAVAELGPAGYGVLPMSYGAGEFKDAILSVLSQSLLDLIGNDTVTSGMQTFDGSTLSSLVATMNSSLRESTHAVAERIRNAQEEEEIAELEAILAEKAAKKVAEDDAEAEVTADVEGEMAEATTEVQKVEPEPAAAEAEPEDDEVAELQAALEAKKAAKAEKAKPRSDGKRLRTELEAAYLAPVRLALGLPVVDELTVEAAKSLLKARCTIKDLEEQGYPEQFKEAMLKAGAAMIEAA